MNCDPAYRERALLLAHLATLYPAHLQVSEDEPGYTGLFLALATGQTAWYIKDDDLDLFSHVPYAWEEHDGHTVEMRFRRVLEATEQRATGTR